MFKLVSNRFHHFSVVKSPVPVAPKKRGQLSTPEPLPAASRSA